MKKQFFKHGLVYGAANVISGMGTVILVPVYTHALQPGDYGVVDYIGVLQILIQICAGLEITQAIARFYSSAGTDEERRAFASTGLWFLLCSFASVCVVLYAVAWTFGAGFIGLGRNAPLFGLALLSVYMRILFYALQSQLRWELRADLYSVASVVAVTCSAALVAYLLLVRHAGLVGVFAGLSAGYGAACAFCLLSLRHTYRWQFDGSKFRQMVRFSLPLMLSSLALFFASYGDRIILKSVLGFEELGIYGIGARVAAVITLAINGFQLGAAPLIYRHYDEPETPATMAQLMRLFLAAALFGVVGLAVFSIEVLRIFTTPEYAAAWRLVPVLAFAMVLSNLYIFLPGLTVRNLTGRFAAINVATAITTLALIATLLRLFGVIGAALGVFGGAAAGFVMHAIFSQQVYRIPFAWPRIAASLAITVAAIGVTWIVGAPGAVSFGIRALVFAAATAGLMAALSTSDERALLQRAVVSGAVSLWGVA